MKRSVVFLFFAAITSFASSAKENKDLYKADYYYNHNAFTDALPCYERAVSEGSSDPMVYARLADCYRMTGDAKKAAATFAKAVKLKGCPDAVFLQYGQVLMQVAKYDEAGEWFKKYQAKNKSDRRAANLAKACEDNLKTENAIPAGFAKLAAFNSEGSDMAPTRWNGKLVYSTDAGEIRAEMREKTNEPLYRIYGVTCDSLGNCGNDKRVAVNNFDVNFGFHSSTATFTADGKQMFFSRSGELSENAFSNKAVANREVNTVLGIAIASDYNAKTGDFKTVTPFQFNSEEYSSTHPAISPGGRVLVFASDMPKGNGGYDLYLCKRSGRDKWSKPQSLGTVINTEGQELFPYWADERTLFFSSDGQGGLGGLDIYKSTWDSVSNKFSAPEHIEEPINSPYDDMSLALYADGRSSWFSSNRPANPGGDNVYFYKKEKIFLNILVRDSLTGQPISNAKVAMKSAKHSADATTGDDGRLITRLYPEQQYKISVEGSGYPPAVLSALASGIRETDTIYRSIMLYADARLNFTQNLDATPGQPGASSPTPVPMQQLSFEKVVGIPQVDKVYEIGKFYFAYKSTGLSDTAKAVLDSLVSYLKQKPTMRIQVRAHTDCRGGSAYNMKLSTERAAMVAGYLVQNGIATNRVEHKGFGDTMPVVPCPGCQGCTEEQHSLNRVLEFKVLHL